MLLVTTPIHEISTRLVPGGGPVEVDLRHTAFLDSHGIAGLLAGYEAATLAGRGFRVVNAAGMVRQVLEITGLAEVFAGPPS